jgi:hypothetical protein
MTMNDQNSKELFINPYYAIRVSPELTTKHEVMATKEQWVKVNSQLIDEMGKEEWLTQLLTILETGTLPTKDDNSNG